MKKTKGLLFIGAHGEQSPPFHQLISKLKPFTNRAVAVACGMILFGSNLSVQLKSMLRERVTLLLSIFAYTQWYCWNRLLAWVHNSLPWLTREGHLVCRCTSSPSSYRNAVLWAPCRLWKPN